MNDPLKPRIPLNPEEEFRVAVAAFAPEERWEGVWAAIRDSAAPPGAQEVVTMLDRRAVSNVAHIVVAWVMEHPEQARWWHANFMDTMSLATNMDGEPAPLQPGWTDAYAELLYVEETASHDAV